MNNEPNKEEKKTPKLDENSGVLVEGFIETEGEIHHLMHKASITKEPYVVFCTGMSTSVKMLILENNKRNITECN